MDDTIQHRWYWPPGSETGCVCVVEIERNEESRPEFPLGAGFGLQTLTADVEVRLHRPPFARRWY